VDECKFAINSWVRDKQLPHMVTSSLPLFVTALPATFLGQSTEMIDETNYLAHA
jgi:hypothetical protein